MNYKKKLELLSIYLKYYYEKKSNFNNYFDINSLLEKMDIEEKSYIRNIQDKWFENTLSLDKTIEIEKNNIKKILNRLDNIRLLKNENNRIIN